MTSCRLKSGPLLANDAGKIVKCVKDEEGSKGGMDFFCPKKYTNQCHCFCDELAKAFNLRHIRILKSYVDNLNIN